MREPRPACCATTRAKPAYPGAAGFGPLRDWVATELGAQGLRVDASQVLITTGSQQGLDLVGKVLIDSGSTVAVEAPTYLGALQAFNPYEPEYVSVACDDDGPMADALAAARGARFLYALPNFQNPSGRCVSAARRDALVNAAQALGLPLVEDNPYGELWFDEAPPAALASRWPEGTVYLGSFSKVLAPGLRLGYVVAPQPLCPKLLQAKQAADMPNRASTARGVRGDPRRHVCSSTCLRSGTLPRQRDDEQRPQGKAPGCAGTPEGGMFRSELRRVDPTPLLRRRWRRHGPVPARAYSATHARHLRGLRGLFARATQRHPDAGATRKGWNEHAHVLEFDVFTDRALRAPAARGTAPTA